jgi:uncharacterized oligopeptide transporter (OPT) family protein
VTAEFFALAFTAAANPKLLALDLLVIENRRPRAMFASVLAGGMSLAVAVGLVDVLVVRADLVNSQKKVSAGVDLAIGLLLLAGGVLLLTGLVPRRRRSAATHSEPVEDAKQNPQKGSSWIQRSLSEPRLLLAFAIGALIGLPGAVAVLIFVIIEFLLIIIPWLFLERWPERTASFLRRCQKWLAGHVKQLVVAICLALGAYLAISALVRLAAG